MQSIPVNAAGRKLPRETKRHRTSDTTALTRSPEDAAAFAGVGRSAIYEALTTGDLKAHKLGRRTLITTEDLTAWIVSLPTYKSNRDGRRRMQIAEPCQRQPRLGPT